MRWLGKTLGYTKPEHWYAIQQRHFRIHHGAGFLAAKYSDSPIAAVREFMPRRQWHSWLFARTPQGYWQDLNNRRQYMRWLAKQLKIDGKEDWYRITKQDFADNGGAGLLANYYDSSVALAIKEFSPKMILEEWKFQFVPNGFWCKPANRRRYMDWLALRLRIRTPELWYGVSVDEVTDNYGITLLTLCGGSYAEWSANTGRTSIGSLGCFRIRRPDTGTARIIG